MSQAPDRSDACRGVREAAVGWLSARRLIGQS
jgi:hypothetical protein